MQSLIYPRHVAGLVIVAAPLVALSLWHRLHHPLISVAVYGALYSAVTVATLRGRYEWRRRFLFVGAAAALSVLSFSAGFYAGRWIGLSSLTQYLAICAGAGAIAYALLLRQLFMTDLSMRALLLIPIACVVAVLAAVLLAGLDSRHLDAVAVAWWFTFSAGLWCDEYRGTATI